MIQLDQAANEIRNVARLKVRNAQKKAALIAANDALALIKKRVIDQGEKADGKKFDDYSTVELPYFFFEGKSRTGSDAALKRAKKAQKGTEAKGLSYKDWRQANNLQTKHKDFKFTGRMWASVRPIFIDEQGSKIVVRINATNEENIKKIEWNSLREGNILLPSKKELQLIRESYNTNFIKNFEL